MKHSLCFLMGVGAGAGLALLYAPQSGEKTQKMISKKIQKGMNEATSAGQKGLDQVIAMGEKGMKHVAATGKLVQDQVGDLSAMVQKERARLRHALEAGVEAYDA